MIAVSMAPPAPPAITCETIPPILRLPNCAAATESRALRKLLREASKSPYVFISERHAPLSVAGYQRMIARAGVAAKFTFLVHSHMLRHACGFELANDGHDTRAIQAYLGHRSIMSTVRYTALTPNRFRNFWKDQLSVSDQTTTDGRDANYEAFIGVPWEGSGCSGHNHVAAERAALPPKTDIREDDGRYKAVRSVCQPCQQRP